MSEYQAISEEILLAIESLSQESLKELVSFIEYLQYKNQIKKSTSIPTSQLQQITKKTTIASLESEELIEEMLKEIGSSIPPLSDYAISRNGIYEDHP